MDTSPEAHGEAVEGEDAVEGVAEDEESGKECLICLSEARNTIIMPCGHLCICAECGQTLKNKKYNCPICRGLISYMIPFDISKRGKKAM